MSLRRVSAYDWEREREKEIATLTERYELEKGERPSLGKRERKVQRQRNMLLRSLRSE